ncbi:MAG: hypothetical protein IKX44_06425 [Prevotella sp.]|nr:hypothetical protein [Prevotella sp.]
MKKVIYSMLALLCAAFAFTSCEDVPMPYDHPGEGGEEPVVVEPTGDGTLENPFNVAAALEYVNNLGADEESPTNVYIKGKVVTVTEEYTTSYGNGTYYISDDGTNKNQFYVYRALYLGNKNFANGNTQIQEGDEVIICGKVVNFKGTTPETVQKKAFLYSLNGVTAGGGGSSTGIEVTCAKAVELTNALDNNATSSEVYSVTGYITEVVGSVSKNQQTFWMADTKDGGKVFEAYYANLPEGVSQFTKGTKVKITGNLTKYVNNNTGNVTAEMKNPDVEILEDGGGGDTPSGTEINCNKAVELTNALADNGTSSEVYSVTGYITEVVGSVSKNQQTFWMADTKDGGKVFEAYWANLPEGVSEFKAGMKVKITGNLMKYVKDGKVTPEIKNATVVVLEDGGGGGGSSSGTEINCNKAVELTNALADGATSSEVYSVTGYITEVVGSVSKNQQTFWMADTKDGGKVFEAYWANLPEGVSEFNAGMKVKITGNLMKYVKDGKVTPEIKNPTVVILEEGSGGGGGGETSGNVTKTIDGTVVTFVVADKTEGDKVTVDLNAQGWENSQEVKSLTISDGTVITFAVSSEGGTTPKYYEATKGVRLYAKNILTITGKDKAIAKVILNCDSYSGTNYVGNDALKGSASGNTLTIVNEHTGTSGGVQLRIQTIEITYAK